MNPTLLLLSLAVPVSATGLSGHTLLVTSVRTNDTEVFMADPTTGDLFNVTRSPHLEDQYPCWSPDGSWISFRKTDERYWGNPERMKLIYSAKPADKRPAWVIRPDGSAASLNEPLHDQMAIEGSRANWKPLRH